MSTDNHATLRSDNFKLTADNCSTGHSVSRVVFPNGVTLLIDQAPHFKSTACSVSLVGGMRTEQQSEAGVSHLLEHLLFKRSNQKSVYQIASIMDELGGGINAYTDAETLTLHGIVPKESLLSLIDFLAELILENGFNADDLELEKEVIRQEILETQDDPTEAVNELFYQSFWPDSSLGRAVYGSLQSVESLTLDIVRRRLESFLQGGKIVVSVVGDVDVTEVTEVVAAKFSSLPVGARDVVSPPFVSSGVNYLPRPVGQVYLLLGYNWPAVLSEDYYAGLILATVLGGGMSSRLFQELREKRALVYDVDTEIDSYVDAAAMLISASVTRDNLNQSLDIIFAELSLLSNGEFSTELLRRAVNMHTAQLAMEQDSIGSRQWRLLETEIICGHYISTSQVISKMNKVTKEDVIRMLKCWYQQDNFCLVLGGDVTGLSR